MPCAWLVSAKAIWVGSKGACARWAEVGSRMVSQSVGHADETNSIYTPPVEISIDWSHTHRWVWASMVDFSSDVSATGGAKHTLSSCQHEFFCLLLNVELHSRRKNRDYIYWMLRGSCGVHHCSMALHTHWQTCCCIYSGLLLDHYVMFAHYESSLISLSYEHTWNVNISSVKAR